MGEKMMEYVVFQIADEEFGLPVNQVKEVLKVPQINPLPGCPPFIEGVITLRKHSVMIMDLRKRFGMSETDKDIRPKHVVIVRMEGMVMGILVDRVNDIVEIPETHIDSTTNFADGYLDNATVTGIAHIGERVVIILDFSRVLNADELGALSSVRGR